MNLNNMAAGLMILSKHYGDDIPEMGNVLLLANVDNPVKFGEDWHDGDLSRETNLELYRLGFAVNHNACWVW